MKGKTTKERENLLSQQSERIKCISDHTHYYKIVKNRILETNLRTQPLLTH